MKTSAARRAGFTAVLALGLCASAQGAVDNNEVLLKLRSSSGVASLAVRHGLSLQSALGSRPIYRAVLPAGASMASALTALRADPEVLIAEANVAQGSPESVRGSLPWAIGTPDAFAAQWAGSALALPQVHALATGKGVTVAVLDTGVDATHPALANRLRAGWDFVDGDADPSETGGPADAGWGHGTHVAGLVAMVAPGATILPLRVLDAQGQGSSWAVAEALLHAVDPDGNPATADGAQVINLSLGTDVRTEWMRVIKNLATCSTADGWDPASSLDDPGYGNDKIRCAASGGAVVVAGAGNGASTARFYPAAEDVYGLLAVAASNAAGRLASFSNYGGWIGTAAPGEQVTSLLPGGLYASWSGTSMAAPLVAGTAALMKSVAPRMPAKDVQRCIENTGTRLYGTEIRQVDPLRLLRMVAIDPRSCR